MTTTVSRDTIRGLCAALGFDAGQDVLEIALYPDHAEVTVHVRIVDDWRTTDEQAATKDRGLSPVHGSSDA